MEKEISSVMSGFVLVCFFFAMGFYKNTAWENPEKIDSRLPFSCVVGEKSCD